MCLSPQHAVVACNAPGGGGGGWLSFLDMGSGAEAGRADLGGRVRALPAVDPWQGLIWVPVHGRRLCLCRAPGAVQGSHGCGRIFFTGWCRLLYITRQTPNMQKESLV